MSEYDLKFDLKTKATDTYISQSSDFAFYLEKYFIYKYHTEYICSLCINIILLDYESAWPKVWSMLLNSLCIVLDHMTLLNAGVIHLEFLFHFIGKMHFRPCNSSYIIIKNSEPAQMCDKFWHEVIAQRHYRKQFLVMVPLEGTRLSMKYQVQNL